MPLFVPFSNPYEFPHENGDDDGKGKIADDKPKNHGGISCNLRAIGVPVGSGPGGSFTPGMEDAKQDMRSRLSGMVCAALPGRCPGHVNWQALDNCA
jgi:hypothetical protein